VGEQGQEMKKRREGGRPRRGEILALAGLSVLALLVRLDLLTDRELWLDEAYTALVVQSDSLGEMLRSLATDNYPPLYFLALRAWTALFGAGEAAVRLPSVIAGVALVPLIWWLVREVGRPLGAGAGARLLAATLAAFSPLLIHYSLEARPYTLLWALAVGVLVFLHRLLERAESRALVAAAGLSAIALGVHYFAVLLAPVWGVVAWGARSRRGKVVGAAGLALLPVVVWVVWLAHRPPGAAAWLEGFWHGPLAALGGSLQAMSLAAFPDYLGTLGAVKPRPLLAGVLGLGFGLPVAAGWVRCVVSSRLSARGWFLPAAALGPAVLLALVSLAQPVYLVGRYELIGYPAWIALWALGVCGAVRWLTGAAGSRTLRRAGWSAAAVATCVGVALLLGLYRWVSPKPWAVHRIAEQAVTSGEDEEVLVAVGLLWAPVKYQLRRLGSEQEPRAFPPEIEGHPGWMDPDAWTAQQLQAAAETLRARLDGRPVRLVAAVDAGGQPRQPGLVEPLARTLLACGYRVAEREDSDGLGVWRFVPEDPRP